MLVQFVIKCSIDPRMPFHPARPLHPPSVAASPRPVYSRVAPGHVVHSANHQNTPSEASVFMLTPLITRLVTLSIRRPGWIIVLSLLLSVLSSYYVVHHFKISTDINQLIEMEPEWAARGQAIDKAFPQRGSTVLVVVEAQAPEFADAAANELAAALAKRTDHFT